MSRFVQPRWEAPSEDQDDENEDFELNKCAACSRFFVDNVPFHLFMEQGKTVLMMDVCDECAAKVLGAQRVS